MQTAKRLSLYGQQRDWIYAVRIMRTGNIKIGFTSSIGDRLKVLKSKYQSDIEPLGLMPGTFQQERALHKQLSASRAMASDNFEEYHATPEIMDLIANGMLHPHQIYDASFPLISIYEGPTPGAPKPLTLSAVDRACHQIMTRNERPSKQKSCLINRVRRERERGHDMSQAIAIIKDRLGLEIAI